MIANVPTYLCLDDDHRRPRARPPRRAGGQAGQRVRRLRRVHRPRGHRGRAGRGPPARVEADPRNWVAQPIAAAVDRADAVRRQARAPPPRPAPVHPLRRPALRHPGRPRPGWRCPRARWSSTAPRAAAARTPGSSTPTGRPPSPRIGPGRPDDRTCRTAEQLACCCPESPRTSTGPAATSSGPRPRPASSRCHTELYLDLPRSAGVGWAPLLAVTGSRGGVRRAATTTSTEDDVIALPRRRRRPTPARCVAVAGRPARTCAVTRGQFPREAWEVLNDLHHWVDATPSPAPCPAQPPGAGSSRCIGRCQLLTGVARRHDEPRRRLRLPRDRPQPRAGRHDHPGPRRRRPDPRRRQHDEHCARTPTSRGWRAAVAVGPADVPPGGGRRCRGRRRCGSCSRTRQFPVGRALPHPDLPVRCSSCPTRTPPMAGCAGAAAPARGRRRRRPGRGRPPRVRRRAAARHRATSHDAARRPPTSDVRPRPPRRRSRTCSSLARAGRGHGHASAGCSRRTADRAGHRRDGRARRRRAPALGRPGRRPRRARPRRAGPAAGDGAACSTTTASPTTSTASAEGRGRRLELDPVPLSCRATSGRRIESGRRPARRAARPGPRRPVRAPRPAPARGCCPPEVVLRPPRVPAAVRPDPHPRRPAAVHLRRRPRPGPRRRRRSSWPTAPRRRRAPATRSRTGSSCRGCCPSLLPRRRGPPPGAVLPGAAGGAAGGGPARRPTSPASWCSPPARWSETAFEHAFLASLPRLPAGRGLRPDRARTAGCGCARSAASSRSTSSCAGSTPGYCDPLELRPDSQLGRARPGRGVPARHRVGGQPARQRRAREPGAAAVPARPGRARSSARSCGCRRCRRGGAATEAARQHVLAHLDQLVVKPIDAGPASARHLRLDRSPTAELDELRAPHRGPAPRVGRPGAGRAGSTPRPSPTAACEPRRTVLRTFAVARDDSYVVMPGGLTRVGADADERGRSRARPARSARTPGCWPPSPRS